MDLKRLFVFFKSSRSREPKPLLDSNLDKKLVLNSRANFLPSWTQYKYITRFLNSKEKKIINIATIVAFLSSLIWLGIFTVGHLQNTPKVGGEYVEALVGQPKLINPLFSTVNDVDMDLVSLIYSGLFRYNKDQKLVPDLAISHKISDDKKVYEISLRQDVKWSDGESFSADDVIYTFEAIQNPDIGSPLYPAFQGVSVEKKDDFTIQFILKEPFAPFLNSLTVGILPEHIWSGITPANIKLAKNNLQPIGTGPWLFSKLVKDDLGTIQSYVLEQNNLYYKNLPYLKTLTFQFFYDFTQASEALRTQNIMALSFIPDNLKDKISKNNFNIYNFQMPQYTALFFNQNKQAFLKDLELRSALSLAINKQVIVQNALNGAGKIVNSPILPGFLGYNPEGEKDIYDLEKSAVILDKTWTRIQPEEYFKLKKEQIIKERKADFDRLIENASTTPETVSSTIEALEKEIEDGVRNTMSTEQTYYRKDKKDNVLKLTITTVDTDRYAKTAESIAKMWRAVGIQTDIQTVSAKQIVKEVLKNRNYQILLYGEVIGNDPDPYPFWHSSQAEYPGLNLSMFVNREADKLLEDARTTIEDEKRGEFYKKFQEILTKEMPAVFLFSPAHSFVASKEIKGVNLTNIFTPADRYNDLQNWYTKTKWTWK